MEQGPGKKEQQRRLMSDASSHSGEETDDTVQICRSYDEDASFCSKLQRSKTAKLVAMLCMIVGYFFTELIVGHITKSLTLVADSFHMLSDALSLVVALFAVRMSRRTASDPLRPWPSKEPYFNTFGWVRFEVLGALINSTFLLALCISITLEAIEKFTDPESVECPKLVLAVGGGGLAVNIFGLVIFGSHSHGHDHHGHGHSHGHSKDKSNKSVSEDPHSDSNEPNKKKKKKAEDHQHLNMKAVFLHVLGDALGSVIVMISATVLWLLPPEKHPWTMHIDPAMSLILVCIMIFTTVPLFKQSSMILLQTVPKHIKLEVVRSKLRKITGIQAIHDLHIWQLAGDKIVASVHVQCANAETYLSVVQQVKESLHDEGIHSFTVQPEFSFSDDEQSPFCQLVCGESCVTKTCCPQDSAKANTSPVPDAENATRVLEQTALTSSSTSPPAATTLKVEEEKPGIQLEAGLPLDFVTSSPERVTPSPVPENSLEKDVSASEDHISGTISLAPQFSPDSSNSENSPQLPSA